MNKLEQLYEGKAKKVYSTEDPNVVIASYKDDATAFDGAKKGTITGKGAINNQMSNYLMQQLEKVGVPTHFVEELSERETAVKKVSIVPLEVIVRNISAGHFASNYGVKEGIVFDEPTIEFSYKNDDLHDPLINDYHAVALKLATWDEIDLIKQSAFQVNDCLKKTLAECGFTPVSYTHLDVYKRQPPQLRHLYSSGHRRPRHRTCHPAGFEGGRPGGTGRLQCHLGRRGLHQ